jgi:hypothetical protein
MKSKLKNLLLSTSLILFMSCSTTIDKSKIVGSWYFVDYTDKPYSKTELEKFEKEIKSSPEGWIKHFNYNFNKNNTYEYKIYNSLTSKGTFSTNQEDLIFLFDRIKSKNDTMKLEYLDDKFLQVKNSSSGTERTAIFYKTQYKFPEVEVNISK